MFDATVLLYAAEDAAVSIRNRVRGITTARRVDRAKLAVGLITEPTLRLARDEHQRRLAELEERVVRHNGRLAVPDFRA